MIKAKFQRMTLLLCISATLILAQQYPDRVVGSPYPFSQIPDTLFVVEDNSFSQAELFTIQTLQGVLAKTKAMIYRDRGVGYSLWLTDLINNYGIIVNEVYKGDFTGLVTHFKERVAGHILCNVNSNSGNAAISLCGLFNAIAITSEHSALMTTLSIAQISDVRNKDEQWVLTQYDSLLSKDIVIYQKEEKTTFLGDYAIFSKGFHFFDNITSSFTNTAFERMNDNSALFGWGDDEHQTVSKASSHSIHTLPADWAVNLSTMSNVNAACKQITHIDSIHIQDNQHTVCFVMTDGDNIQWALGDFATSPKWYGSPNRGKVNLGWTISPSLCELAPTVLKYLYTHAANTQTGKDFFVAGPSGLGYIFPDLFDARDSAGTLLNRFMAKADLNIVNIIGNNKNETFLKPYLSQEHCDALFYYDYSNYSGLGGEISWIENKPVICGRYNLWDGFESPQSLARKLNALPKNANSADGYSLIPVHAWSMSVDDVITCASLLDNNVVVVTPEEFVMGIYDRLGQSGVLNDKQYTQKSDQLYYNVNQSANSISFFYNHSNATKVTLEIYNSKGCLINAVSLKNQSAGTGQYQWDYSGHAQGIYFSVLSGRQKRVFRKIVLY